MTGGGENSSHIRITARGRTSAAIFVAAFAAGLALLVPEHAAAQTAQVQSAPLPPPQVASQPAPEAAPRPAENPGLINEIGKLFQSPNWTLPTLPKLKSPAETINDWNVQAKSVTDTLQGVGSSTIAKGRVSCPMTAHGAPDCKAASDTLCKSKGFKEGKSLDTDSARTCSPQALLTGRKLEEKDCKTEHYVTQAMCQ